MFTRQKLFIDKIEAALGESVVRKDWLNFACPFHNDNGFHLGVNTSSMRFYCWVCLEQGTVKDLLRMVDPINKGLTVYKTRKQTKYLEVHREDRSILVKGKPVDFESDTSPAVFKRLTGMGLTPDHITPIIRYPGVCIPGSSLNTLGDRENIINTYIGLEHVEDSLTKRKAIAYLIKRGFNDLSLCGFIPSLNGRIVFPFYMGEKFVYYQARCFVPKFPKIINPDERHGWTNKNSVLWRYDLICKSKIDTICLTEGIFDANSVTENGGIIGVPLLGSAINDSQIRLLNSLQIKVIYVFLDSDAFEKSILVAKELYDCKFVVYLVRWEEGIDTKEDPNSINPSLLKVLLNKAEKFTHSINLKLRIEYGL